MLEATILRAALLRRYTVTAEPGTLHVLPRVTLHPVGTVPAGLLDLLDADPNGSGQEAGDGCRVPGHRRAHVAAAMWVVRSRRYDGIDLNDEQLAPTA